MESIIKYPLSTEKAVRLMQTENKLVFVVDRKANKAEIKKAIEGLFKAKVLRVNTQINHKGQKIAYVKFSQDSPAMEVGTNLGLM